MIYKDLEVHGKDIVTSLRRAIERCPSVKFQEMLQGGITTITSGGDLTAYFRQKAARYQWENRVEQKTFIETMGLMAETYVTAAVAGPPFLLARKRTRLKSRHPTEIYPLSLHDALPISTSGRTASSRRPSSRPWASWPRPTSPPPSPARSSF